MVYPSTLVADYSYDTQGRVAGIHNQTNGATLSSYEYRYDANGNRTQQIEVNGGDAQTTDYAYDSEDRLTDVTYPDTQVTYTYDANFNRLTENTTRIADNQLIRDWVYDYNNRNELTAITDRLDAANSIAYRYDANGNQIEKVKGSEVSQFTYDARNQLRQVAIGGTEVGRFAYDHRGLRVEKQGERGIERNTYDGDSLLLQSDTSGNLLAHYRYGAFRLLSLTESGKDSEYYVFDSLGSPVNLTTLGGDVTARYQYDAWGHKRLDASTSWNRISFTGHEEDTETGLIYAKARFYDPDTGRFLTQDPWEGDISIAPSLHKYLYAYGNPTVYWDRDGLKSIFGDATQQLANFKEWLGEKNIEADSQWAAAAIGTAQFVTTLGEGITRPLDVVANLAQVATGVDDQQVRDELAGTKQAIKGAADFVVHGDYGQAVANIHEKAVSETVSALEGKVDATANLTQGILAIATLREVGPRGNGGVVKESASSTSAKVQAETAGLERIKANVAQNKSLNERINERGEARADVSNLNHSVPVPGDVNFLGPLTATDSKILFGTTKPGTNKIVGGHSSQILKSSSFQTDAVKVFNPDGTISVTGVKKIIT